MVAFREKVQPAAPDLTLTSMRRNIPLITDTTFDLLIAGGLFRVRAAREACLQPSYIMTESRTSGTTA
jgi:hypothetical protein